MGRASDLLVVARIKSLGDQGLFGGELTQQMKQKLKVPTARPLAYFIPTVIITAKTSANEIKEHNVTSKELDGETQISHEHESSNKAIRKAIVDCNVIPEKLPAAEEINKLQFRLTAAGKRSPKELKRLQP